MTKVAKFTEADVKRALRAAERAGKEVCSFSIDREGAILVHLAGSAEKPRGPTPLDRAIHDKYRR